MATEIAKEDQRLQTFRRQYFLTKLRQNDEVKIQINGNEPIIVKIGENREATGRLTIELLMQRINAEQSL